MPSANPVPDALPPALRASLEGEAPRATRFIVTIYGDVAEPRGGTLWMGTLIETCAVHGISESLVRTAVSRLVGAGRLVGERVGRRSYYRLTDDAQAEFAAAARILYAPPPEATGWLVSLWPEALDATPVVPGWARIGASAAMAPDRADVARPGGPLLGAQAISGEADLPAFAARHWPLGEVADAYRQFLSTFAPVAAALDAGPALVGPAALALRLRLVHRYRHAALADPRLPRTAWPADWPGAEARALFVRLYLALAAEADRQIGLTVHDPDGLVPAETASSRLRLDRMRREAKS